jgi:UDP-2,4-diacetamido-2,4,6-trideoxy-beta-L-altropyranose hydrolase/UDP-4-amino-4,6-dideoxy-N-acetyl-beta-L-altrosamine N-acetyltransferase
MKLALRADAYPELGSGHLMRCLALAQGAGELGRKVVFITHCESGALLDRVRKEGFKLYEFGRPGGLEETVAILRGEKPDWAVLDGYHMGSYQKAIKDLGCRLLVIDDYAHLEHYTADIILNQNYGAEKFRYSAEPYTRFLLGTEYVLLRREFLRYTDFKRTIPDMAKKLLITMGGGDPENNTLKVLRAVNLIDAVLDVKIIIGVSNPHLESISKEADSGRHNTEMLTAVEDMARLMAWADAAVSAGGTTLWELAFMGLPSVLFIVADNQENAVNALSMEGFPSAGWIKNTGVNDLKGILKQLLYDNNLRAALAEKGREIVDGRGAERVSKEMDVSQSDEGLRKDFDFDEVRFINFINLTDKEKELVRGWRNSDEIRKWMFTDHIISKEEHLRFIENLKKDGMNFYWMARVNDSPAWVVYLQNVDTGNKSSYFGIYSVRKGDGKTMLHHLLHLCFEILQMLTLKCELIEGNEKAYRLYERFGFKPESSVHFIDKGGAFRKVIAMSLDKEEWKKEVL